MLVQSQRTIRLKSLQPSASLILTLISSYTIIFSTFNHIVCCSFVENRATNSSKHCENCEMDIILFSLDIIFQTI